MQTFLPLPDIQESLRVLDYRRLGKQRLEALQIWKISTGKSVGWKQHPAARMWEKYPRAIALYYNKCVTEWLHRGYKNTMQLIPGIQEDEILPSWFGDENFHASHRSNLLRKNFIFYSKFGWSEPNNLPYVWPIGDTV